MGTTEPVSGIPGAGPVLALVSKHGIAAVFATILLLSTLYGQFAMLQQVQESVRQVAETQRQIAESQQRTAGLLDQVRAELSYLRSMPARGGP